MTTTHACTLCGARDCNLLAGQNGFACFECLGHAFAAVASTHDRPRGPADFKGTLPHATKRCLICDEAAPQSSLVAFRHPHVICGTCLKAAFEISMEGSEPLGVVAF